MKVSGNRLSLPTCLRAAPDPTELTRPGLVEEFEAALLAAARDIGAAFIENPEAIFDTACAEALIPTFILPDASRSKSYERVPPPCGP